MNFDQLLKVRSELMSAVETIDNELLKTDWRHFANRGLKILAIRAYSRQHKSYIKEAKEAVENFMKFLDS